MTTRRAPKKFSTDSKTFVTFSAISFYTTISKSTKLGTLQKNIKKQQKLFYQSFRNVSIIVTLVFVGRLNIMT